MARNEQRRRECCHVFPQFADGPTTWAQLYFRTTPMVSNPSTSTSTSCTLRLYGLTVNGSNVTLGPGGWILSPIGSNQSLRSGYATLQCSANVEAQVKALCSLTRSVVSPVGCFSCRLFLLSVVSPVGCFSCRLFLLDKPICWAEDPPAKCFKSQTPRDRGPESHEFFERSKLLQVRERQPGCRRWPRQSHRW